jgi:FMN phosphatase YigB (HAD superfamily)
MTVLNKPKTVFCDIDGTLIPHCVDMTGILSSKPNILPGVLEKFNEWDSKGYKIILTTGRKESSREHTEQQLRELGLFWDYLLMGIGGGQRILINDIKPSYPDIPMAVAINLERDKGLGEVNI